MSWIAAKRVPVACLVCNPSAEFLCFGRCQKTVQMSLLERRSSQDRSRRCGPMQWKCTTLVYIPADEGFLDHLSLSMHDCVEVRSADIKRKTLDMWPRVILLPGRELSLRRSSSCRTSIPEMA